MSCQREEFTHDARKLLGDKGIERIAVCHVGIAGELYRGHDNRDIVCVGITLNRGAALPHRFVVAHAVQKPNGTVTTRRNFTLRKNDLNGDVQSVKCRRDDFFGNKKVKIGITDAKDSCYPFRDGKYSVEWKENSAELTYFKGLHSETEGSEIWKTITLNFPE